MLARTRQALGLSGSAALREARELARDTRPALQVRFEWAAAAEAEPLKVARRTGEALAVVLRHDLAGYEIAARVLHARALLRAGEARQALAQAQEAVRLLPLRAAHEFSPAEALLTLSHVMAAARVGDSDAAMHDAQRWIDGVAFRHVPPEYRSSFRKRALAGVPDALLPIIAPAASPRRPRAS